MKKFKYFLKSQKGLTFVELIIVTVIIAFAISTVFITINTSNNSMQTDQIIINDINQARTALNQIVQEINFASRDSSFDIVNDTKNTGSSILKYTANVGGTNQNCSIYLQNGVIFLKQGSGTPIPLTNPDINSVKILQFSTNSDDPTNNTITTKLFLSDNTQFETTARKLNQKK